jgi:ribosomal protein S18 acetylase RimI-like enzyme
MAMRPVAWLRFAWDCADLRVPSAPGGFSVLPARRDEKREALEVVLRSFSMDSQWNDSYLRMERYLAEEVERLFQFPEPLCLLLRKGNRPVSASLLDPDPEAPHHMVSGPCVTMEYRNRGIGSLMLAESLRALGNAGLAVVRGITRSGTVSARFIYPKFGSSIEPWRFPGEEACRGIDPCQENSWRG